MTRKSLLFLQLGLLVAASLPPASKQMEVSLKKWLADNQLLYTTPDAEDTAMDAGVVTASKAQVHVGVDPAGSGSGGGKRRTIAAALAGVPDSGGGEPKSYELSLKPGQVFREKVVVGKGKAYVTLKSDPANPAVINDAPSGLEGGKTVALRHPSSNARSRPAGKARYTYDDDGQHYFKECTINGGADVIFGFGRSFYDDCRIISKKDPATVVYSTTQAQAQRAPKYDGLDGTTNPAFLGFSFHNCTIEAGAGDSGGADDKVYLGRAWDDSSFVVFSNTMMARSGDYYGVYKCSGPGLEASKKMGWAKELTDGFPYANQEFISGETRS
uniref:pectinesterase n=1 Tax=Oryza rufipogon TaxID=4529 RepID=A0A0E0RBR9_ORYRU